MYKNLEIKLNFYGCLICHAILGSKSEKYRKSIFGLKFSDAEATITAQTGQKTKQEIIMYCVQTFESIKHVGCSHFVKRYCRK